MKEIQIEILYFEAQTVVETSSELALRKSSNTVLGRFSSNGIPFYADLNLPISWQ